jgi:hypothetical protein
MPYKFLALNSYACFFLEDLRDCDGNWQLTQGLIQRLRDD